jgi:phosphoribosyl-dephospho-CoA transferase
MHEACLKSGLPWRRHDLLHVAPDAWAAALARRPSLAGLPLLAAWADRGWPVIVRRRGESEETGLVPIGVPLPPEAGKHRIALGVPAEGIVHRWSPPLLRAAARVAHPAWQPTIASLLSLGARIGLEPAAFGSLMWQHQTGLSYLSKSSDLDLLWVVPAGFDVLGLVSGLARIERAAPLHIDGEIILPDGSAVSWRELWEAHRDDDRPGVVLAKTMEGVGLLELASLKGMRQQA